MSKRHERATLLRLSALTTPFLDVSLDDPNRELMTARPVDPHCLAAVRLYQGGKVTCIRLTLTFDDEGNPVARLEHHPEGRARRAVSLPVTPDSDHFSQPPPSYDTPVAYWLERRRVIDAELDRLEREKSAVDDLLGHAVMADAGHDPKDALGTHPAGPYVCEDAIIQVWGVNYCDAGTREGWEEEIHADGDAVWVTIEPATPVGPSRPESGAQAPTEWRNPK